MTTIWALATKELLWKVDDVAWIVYQPVQGEIELMRVLWHEGVIELIRYGMGDDY
jgi:hypothetical protein